MIFGAKCSRCLQQCVPSYKNFVNATRTQQPGFKLDANERFKPVVAMVVVLAATVLLCSLGELTEAVKECDVEDMSAMLQSRMLSDDASVISSPGKVPEVLEDLLGTWEGSNGMNIVAVPQHTTVNPNDTASFQLLVQDYTETLTFTPIWGKVLNRGYVDAAQYQPTDQLNQVLMGVTYYTEIYELLEDGSKGELLHAENGQILTQLKPGIQKDWTLAFSVLF